MTENLPDFPGEPVDGGDAFDAELQALFDQAAPPAQDPIFTAQVAGALGKSDKVRLLALGGAGASGSAVAGTQIESLVTGPLSQLGGIAGQVAGFLGPEAIVSTVFALTALGIVWIIPKGRFAF